LRSFCRYATSAPLAHTAVGIAARRFLALSQNAAQIFWQGLIGGAIVFN